MSDSGKHSALRQTGDGSFELVFEDGLEELSEDSFAEETRDAPAPEATGRSSRLVPIAGGVVALIIAVVVGVWAVGGDEEVPGAEAEESAAPGFKPYAGDRPDEPNRRSPQPPTAEPAVAAGDETASEEVPPEGEAPPDDEEGWELAEEGEDIVVVDEGVEEEVAEVSDQDAGTVEDGAGDAETVEEGEEPDDRAGRLPGTAVPPSVAPKLGGPVTPKMPRLTNVPLGRRELPDLPVRRINPETGTLDEVPVEDGEFMEGDYVEGEEGDYVEDEYYDDEGEGRPADGLDEY